MIVIIKEINEAVILCHTLAISMCASCNRSHWNRQCDQEVIRRLYMCDSRTSDRIWWNTAGHSLHPAGYSIYTAGCLWSSLEYHIRLTLYPAVHEEARPDITHIRTDVMYIRPDMFSHLRSHSEEWREELCDYCPQAVPFWYVSKGYLVFWIVWSRFASL